MAQKGKCPKCEATITAPDDLGDGLELNCENCGQLIIVKQRWKVTITRGQSSRAGDNAFSDLRNSYPFNLFG